LFGCYGIICFEKFITVIQHYTIYYFKKLPKMFRLAVGFDIYLEDHFIKKTCFKMDINVIYFLSLIVMTERYKINLSIGLPVT
jgi:hypothetical protein